MLNLVIYQPPTRTGDAIAETRSGWGVWGERLRRAPFGAGAPNDKPGAAAAEPERSGGGVRHMLNLVTYETSLDVKLSETAPVRCILA